RAQASQEEAGGACEISSGGRSAAGCALGLGGARSRAFGFRATVRAAQSDAACPGRETGRAGAGGPWRHGRAPARGGDGGVRRLGERRTITREKEENRRWSIADDPNFWSPVGGRLRLPARRLKWELPMP